MIFQPQCNPDCLDFDDVENSILACNPRCFNGALTKLVADTGSPPAKCTVQQGLQFSCDIVCFQSGVAFGAKKHGKNKPQCWSSLSGFDASLGSVLDLELLFSVLGLHVGKTW